MAGALFVVGRNFPQHWRAALEAGFWEAVRHVRVDRGDLLVFWQAGGRGLLGVDEATHPTEPVDYALQSRPWSEGDPTEYRYRYRFDLVSMNIPQNLAWKQLMETLKRNPKRMANSAPFRFERSSERLIVDLEWQVGASGGSAVGLGHGLYGNRLGQPPRRSAMGNEYVDVDESVTTQEGVAFQRDPREVDRGLRGHAYTQNALAAWLRENEIVPRQAGAVNFDLAWSLDGCLYVAEVKSLHSSNERNQIRLGIGEVVDFAYQLGGARRVLAVEHRPENSKWTHVCEAVDVELVWPGEFDRLLSWK